MKQHKILILFVTFNLIAVSQINIRSVETFKVADGLSQTSVHTIFQDSRGLLWLGTEGGMNKFDGYDIISFKTFDSRNILSSRGTIFNVIEDKNGDLWYGSSGLVSRLNIHSETTDNLQLILNGKFDTEFGAVLNLFNDSKGNIWFGTFGQGFYKISNDFNELKNFRNDLKNTNDSSLNYVRDFYEDSNGIIWVATYGGLVKFDPVEESFENLFYRDKLNGLRHTTIFKIIPRGNELLLFTSYNGILVYDISNDEVYEYDEKLNRELNKYPLRTAIIDSKERIWICAYGKGIIIVEPQTKNFYNLLEFVNVENRQALLEPLSIHIDAVGIIWIGTQHDGLYKLIPGEKNIHLINNTVPGYEEIENNVANGIAKDIYGKIWFASNSAVYKIDPKTKDIERLSLSNEFTPYMLRIYNIRFTQKFAWLSFGPYLVKHDLNRDSYEKILIEEDGSVTEVSVIDENTIAVGTTLGNVFLYNTITQNIKKISTQAKESFPNSIIDFYNENDTNLWIGTNNGLFLINLAGDTLISREVPLNLRLDFITSIAGLYKNKLWFGTYGDGLYYYDTITKAINHYTHKDGLPDNTIYGVMFDTNNNLWMSSNRGIFEFNPITNTVRTLDLSDGLQGYEYNSKSYSKSNDGEFFYGGGNGVNSFYPAKIDRNMIPPKILINKVLLYDSVIVTNLSSDFTDVYSFSHYENSISFEFTALDFVNPSKNSYEYKLEGVNNNWIKAGDKRYATFPNINPGEYNFVVRGTNNDQVYNEKGVSFSFVIYPPFWATWWFRTLLITAALLTVYSIYKIRIMNQERRIREIEAIRKRIADDFHDDLGHKLTRISLYSEMIRNQEDFGTNKKLYLDKISEASNSLFYETKDFIWSLDPGNDTVYDVLVYLKDFGDDFFNKSGIAFKVDEIIEDFKKYSLPMKWKREIVLIFKEAMNNVIKHSHAINAELIASVKEGILEITLSDDGRGFAIDQIQHNGRGLTSIKKRAGIVGGKIIIDSEENGTRVKLSLSIKENTK